MDIPCRECIVAPVCSELCPLISDKKDEIMERVSLKLHPCLFCGGSTIITHYIIAPLIEVSCRLCHVSSRYSLPQLLQKWKWI